ncbi:MAG: M23 family metallopeptidase [Chitinophagaceae bacterium]|nr:M23 family metallopeptidase [Anaerolineae bacterium]
MSFKLFWPTQHGHIIQPFGVNWTGDPDFFRRYGLPGHEGIDFQAPDGSEVYACADGVINRIALEGDTDHQTKPYGNQIRITHSTDEGEFETTYAHLQAIKQGLSVDDPVKSGDLIGYADSTGNTRGPNLHLMLKKQGASAAGETHFPKDVIDPTPYLLPFGAPPESEIEMAAAAGRLAPPPAPRAYNGRYRLQTDESQFRRAWSWASNAPAGRYLNLIAMRNAPYSDPTRRKTAPGTSYVNDAIQYLNPNTQPSGTPRYWVINNSVFFCNIFVNDVTRLLHCEIPNNPANTSAPQMLRWMQSEGEAHGWRAEDSGRDAQNWVNNGRVAVMIYVDGTNGHAALIRPGEGRAVSGRYWPRLAQAGRIVSGNIDGYEVFRRVKPDRIFTFLHD